MIIYITDRNLDVMIHASTTLPDGYRVFHDKTVESVDTGVNTFECVISYTDDTRFNLEDACQVGHYILKQRNGMDGAYDTVYQIVETELDTLAHEVYVYAEDAGLDLLNTLCPAVSLSGTAYQMLDYFIPNDWSINIIDAPATTKSYKWDGTATATERILSVANLFGCEVYYSFIIEQLQVTEKVVNLITKRGTQTATAQLRLNYDINNIRTTKSIADLVTAFNVAGGGNPPINLKGYNYSYTDPNTGDVYRVDTTTGQMRNVSAMARWSSSIDTDGLWVGEYSYNTTDKAMLAGQARAQLQKESQIAVNYEVDFARLPDDVAIGDRVNIIDEHGDLYLEARLLQIETCEAEDTKTAIIGEYLLKDSGISAKVAQLASDFAGLVQDPAYTLSITSSDGDVFITTTVATTLTAHVYLFGTELSPEAVADIGVINWYDYYDTETPLGTGITYEITEEMAINAINVTARLESE